MKFCTARAPHGLSVVGIMTLMMAIAGMLFGLSSANAVTATANETGSCFVVQTGIRIGDVGIRHEFRISVFL